MMEKQTIVVKVGTSSLTLSDGTMDACLLYTSDAADEVSPV